MNQLPVKVTYLFILQLGKKQLQFKVTTQLQFKVTTHNFESSIAIQFCYFSYNNKLICKIRDGN